VKSLLTTDYHIHILPGIDDGAKDVQSSVQMLQMCKLHGVERVVATPHYIPHQESIEDFLLARQKSVESLRSAVVNVGDIEILIGAEVFVEKNLSEREDLPRLAIADDRYILLELPYSPFKEWMFAEIYNVIHGYKLVPIFAHLERYLQWYTSDDMTRILSVSEAVFQINNSALSKRKTLRFTLSLIREGFPVIFGSDAHDAHIRQPDTGAVYKALWAKLNRDELAAVAYFSDKLL